MGVLPKYHKTQTAADSWPAIGSFTRPGQGGPKARKTLARLWSIAEPTDLVINVQAVDLLDNSTHCLALLRRRSTHSSYGTAPRLVWTLLYGWKQARGLVIRPCLRKPESLGIFAATLETAQSVDRFNGPEHVCYTELFLEKVAMLAFVVPK